MVSAERIKQFTNIPSEASWHIPGCLPSPNWPYKGDIDIQDLTVHTTQKLYLFRVLSDMYTCVPL